MYLVSLNTGAKYFSTKIDDFWKPHALPFDQNLYYGRNALAVRLRRRHARPVSGSPVIGNSLL